MTQPTPSQDEWHILIFKSKSGFGIGSFLDKILQMETGDTLFEIVPVKIPYSSIPPTTTPVIVPPPVVQPEPPSPPIIIPVPLWRGTTIMALTIRDVAGESTGILANGTLVEVWAGPLNIGGYENRLVISAPGQPRRNVWREGVRKA